MSSAPLDYLRHILAETEYLLRHGAGVALEDFRDNPTLSRAFVRSLEVIGEAAKNIPSEFRDAHPEIEWRGMTGMRDRLIHGYFGVDLDLVWDVVRNRVPILHEQVRALVADAAAE